MIFVFMLPSIRFAKNRGKILLEKCANFPKFPGNFPGGTFSGISGDFRGFFRVSQPENGVNFPDFFAKKSENVQKCKKSDYKAKLQYLRVA